LEQAVTKEQVIAAIRACARKLGRIPTKKQFRQMAGISEKRVCNRFGSFGQAVREAGLEPAGPGYHLRPDALLKDWGAVARKLGKLPTKDVYTANGRYSTVPFESRWKSWRLVPPAFRHYTGETGTEADWSDVLAMIEATRPQLEVGPELVAQEAEAMEAAQAGPRGPGRPPTSAGTVAALRSQAKSKDGQRSRKAPQSHVSKRSQTKPNQKTKPGPDASGGTRARSCNPSHNQTKRPLLSGRTVYGPLLPMQLPGLAHEPMDELGVVYVFGMVAYKLGFTVLRTQSTFPDCEALREIQPGKWQRVRIEFEYESRNFAKHGHNKDECDLIVCWRHNWPECPKELEVVELRQVLREESP
jgi:hypothetical protein